MMNDSPCGNGLRIIKVTTSIPLVIVVELTRRSNFNNETDKEKEY